MNTYRPKVVIVEDDDDLRLALQGGLRTLGYRADSVTSAEALYKWLSVNFAEVIVLDIGLPGESGLEAARYLQGQADIKIIILSGKRDLEDRIAGLRNGADRYLTKPVDLLELCANIDAACRQPPKGDRAAAWALREADWTLCSPSGVAVKLTSNEWSFLSYLSRAPDCFASRESLAIALVGEQRILSFDQRRIDMLVSRLRTKVRTETGEEAPIKTVQGRGFSFAVAAPTAQPNHSPDGSS